MNQGSAYFFTPARLAAHLLLLISAFASGCTALASGQGTNQQHLYYSEPHPALQLQHPLARLSVTDSQQPGRDGRYRNLFASPQQWPHSCHADCYRPDPRVQCLTKAQSAPFVADCDGQVLVRGISADSGLLPGWQLQWTGHASFRLLSPQGQLLLIDPVSAGFDWPLNWLAALAGHSRRQPAFDLLAAAQTPAAVLYSHAHYDHFNRQDALALGRHSPLYLPKGMAQYLPDAGLSLHEMTWYSRATLGDLQLHFVPAHHYSGRSLYAIDGDHSLWGGWVLQFGRQQVYIAGDTGYSPVFSQIRARYGAMDLCLLPIGSYHGEHYRNAHLTPEDALQVATELGCKRLIPWGYGNYSWQMGDKSSHAPLLRLLSMHRQLKSATELQVLNEGEVVAL